MQDVSKRGNPPAPIEGTNQNFFLPGEEGERRDVTVGGWRRREGSDMGSPGEGRDL